MIVYVLGYDLTYPNIIYYPATNGDYLSCIVNVDQAFFGKWWKGTKLFTEYTTESYLTNINVFTRLCWTQIFYDAAIQFTFNEEEFTLCNIYSRGSTYTAWFTTKKLPEYTFSNKTRFFFDSLVNDQSVLSNQETVYLENTLRKVYKVYYHRFLHHHLVNLALWEKKTQWFYGFVENEKKRAHNALNLFYLLKLLPSFVNDGECIDKEEGLNNFCGKIIIFNETHKRIDNLTMEDHMDKIAYDRTFGIWSKYWPTNASKGVLPKWLRVMYTDMWETHVYPDQIRRESLD